MNYYPHHIGDYLKDTAHLTMIEDGAYRRLIDLYYLHEKPLPAEKRQVYRLARAASTAERGAVDTILEEYFTLTDEGWTHRRCDAEVAKSREKSEKARTSAASRWQSKTHRDGNANASDQDANAYANAQETHGRTHSDGNAYPITNNQEPIKKTPPTPLAGGPGWQRPDWVPADLWGEFEALRKKRKKPMTDRSRTLAVAKLQALQDGGNDLKAVMEQSILHAWDTFYPLKPDAAPVGAVKDQYGVPL